MRLPVFFRFFGLLVLAVAAPRLAFAASDTSVGLPVGDWIAAAIGLLNSVAVPIIVALVAWASRVLPSALVTYLNMIRVDQLLERAVGYALTAVQDAAAGKVLTVDVGNKVLATALTYAVEHAPALVAWAGGTVSLREKILARLTVEPAAVVVKDANGVAALSS